MDELEELKNLLYERALAERNAFLDEIRQLPPDQIIPRAYEISMKEDFYYNITEVSEFEPHELRILAALEKPLTACYEKWGFRDQSEYNEDLRVCIEGVVDKELYRLAQIKYANPATPVYPKNWQEAIQNHELAEYEASQNRTYVCKLAFEQGYKKCLDSSDESTPPVLDAKAFRSFLKEWEKTFGCERCLHTLAEGTVSDPQAASLADKVLVRPQRTHREPER